MKLRLLAVSIAISGITFLLMASTQSSSQAWRGRLDADATPQGVPSMSLALTTNSFPAGGDIPSKFTCDGADVSPSLKWDGAPAGTQSFALIVDDPDAPAGTWTHWLIWNIPVTHRELAEGQPKTKELPGGISQGQNDFKRIGYNGPCPPPGKPHRYFFRLYALKAELPAATGATRAQMEEAMRGHVLGKAELMGRYGRQ